MANRHTITDLYQMQSLSLSAKVRMTARRIDDWVNRFGEDGAYVDADTYVYLLCPICGNQVGLDDCVDNYCSCCGQKLDWSDEE